MAQSNRSVKTMSSRLSAMKFMQHAAASQKSSPSTPTEPHSKKQRISNGSYNSTPTPTPLSQAQTPDEASAAEDREVTGPPEPGLLGRRESKWYLSLKEPLRPTDGTALRIVSAGFGTLDARESTAGHDTPEDDGDDSSGALQMPGRRSFGKFNKKIEKHQDPTVSSSESSSDPESSEEGEIEEENDDPTGAEAMIAASRKVAGEKARAERKAKRKAEKAEFERFAEERRKKQVKLNHLTSISGSGGGMTPTRASGGKDLVCHRCGGKGHFARDCPRSSQPTSRFR